MIHLRMTGTGPAVLLLHGAPSPVEDFRPLVERLSPRHTFYWPDLPGYGLTPPTEAKTSVARVQTILEDALLAVGVRQLAVVGYSFGAYRALALALGSKLKVTDVVALGGFAQVGEQDRAGIGQLVAALRAVKGPYDDAFRRANAERVLSPRSVKEHPEWVETAGRWLDLTPPSLLADEYESMAEARDLLPHLNNLKTRVTLRVGADDASTPPRHSEAIAMRMKHAQVQVVPGVGHALLLEDAHRTLEAIDEALKQQVLPHREGEG